MGRFLSGLAAFAASVLVVRAIATDHLGGRGSLIAPVALVGVGIGVGLVPRLRRVAWFVGAAGTPLNIDVVFAPYDVIPTQYPALAQAVLMVPTGLILAGPMLALHDPRHGVRVAVVIGLVAGIAAGPLLLDNAGVLIFLDWAAVLRWSYAGAGVVMLIAGLVALRRPYSTVDSSFRPTGLWIVVAVGAVLGGVQYGLLESHVLAAGDDIPAWRGPRATLTWVWSTGLGIAVTMVLVGLAYRQARAAGARWAVALAALAFPALAAYDPHVAYQPSLVGVRVATGLAGAVLGVLLTSDEAWNFVTAGLARRTRPSGVDRRVAWDAVGLVCLTAVTYQYGGSSHPTWAALLGAVLSGLVIAAALVPLIRPTGAGLAAVGTGFAVWVYARRALAPIAEVDLERPTSVAWPLGAAAAVLALHMLAARSGADHTVRVATPGQAAR